jgi:hypothetical protein
MAGAPVGNTNSRLDNRLWANTIRRAVVQEDGAKLRRIAEKLLALAEDGDIQAMKEIGDRLDGKPAQAVELSGSEGGPLILRLDSLDSKA